MQTSVLLSIKPEFVERIFNGSKQFEFRRKLFTNRNVRKIVIYATAPVSCVVGEFEIEGVIQTNIEDLWEQTKEFSGIREDSFKLYFNGVEKGYAIKIGNPCRYEKPLDLQADFNVKRAPQSFVYVRN